MRTMSALVLLSLPAFMAGAAPEPPAFALTTSQATWMLEMDSGSALLTVTPQGNNAAYSARLAPIDGDPEIHELPDGSMVPAATYRGALGDCSVSADVALGHERAWISLYDCIPDADLPGEWTGSLSLLPVTPAMWTGEWTMTGNGTDASLAITPAGDGLLHVVGLATRQVSEISIHYGEFDIPGRPLGDRLVLDAAAENPTIDANTACRLTLRLAGTALTADDNGRCGGRGVSFDGIYTRREK